MKFNVSSPTPTTVAFTVSTRASLKTVSARLLFFLSVLARMLLGASAILAIWLRWRWSAQAGHRRAHPDGRQYILPFYGDAGTWTGHTILYLTADWLVEQIQLRYLVLVSALALWLAVQRGHTDETLLILRGLGIQTTTSGRTYFSSSSSRFIPANVIQDIWIHEAFKGFEVRFYLAVVVEGEEDVVVVFPKLLPGRQILEEVWRGTKACLYERST